MNTLKQLHGLRWPRRSSPWKRRHSSDGVARDIVYGIFGAQANQGPPPDLNWRTSSAFYPQQAGAGARAIDPVAPCQGFAGLAGSVYSAMVRLL